VNQQPSGDAQHQLRMFAAVPRRGPLEAHAASSQERTPLSRSVRPARPSSASDLEFADAQ
jgi:hypothetical protein